MKSASALGRRHVRLSALVVSAVVVGLILSVSAGARTKSSSKRPAAPSLTPKGTQGSKVSITRPRAGAPHVTLFDLAHAVDALRVSEGRHFKGKLVLRVR